MLTEQALSPQELKAKYSSMHPAGKNLSVVNYNEIIDLDPFQLHQLFDSNLGTDAVVIFYPAMQDGNLTVGHFTCLLRNQSSKTYFFYDPLAYKIDEYKRYTQRRKLYLEKMNSLVKHLLLEQSNGWSIDYNNHQHQSRKPNIATCGRWCIMRCLSATLSNDQFNKLINRLWKDNFGRYKKTKDELIVKLVP